MSATSTIMEAVHKYRRFIVMSIHLLLIALSNHLAFWLRFDGTIPDHYFELFVQMLPWVMLVRAAAFFPFHLYEGLWRYTSIWDLRNLLGGVISSTVVFYAIVRFGFGLTDYPRSIFFIDTFVLICLLGGIRLTRRMFRESNETHREKRILIYGAGDAGEMIVRDMKKTGFHEYQPIGFIDDDPRKVGQRIHGVKVFGNRDKLGRVMQEAQPHAVLVAIPRAAPATIRTIVRALEPFKVPIMTLPNLRDIIGGKVEVSQIRTLSIEDLLERVPVGLNPQPLDRLIYGKRVLVTGAGGSIGSELCRQIMSFGPSCLIMYDRYENGLYAINNELQSRRTALRAVIGDVTDSKRIDAVIRTHRPHLIFHAAAHKHVPLMEANPCEAIKNNVLGTRNLLQSLKTHGVERFILISTDKAVNPCSVMGASKRVAEFLIQSMNRTAPGVCAVVRFGNVLGSNGSVVPLFMEQIRSGGPVTVTHPDVKRYFMLIPEAVQLVLHAAALVEGGDVYVLEMGEQIKVLDMARNLIRLSGLVPDEDIPITYIGMRPGEKLYEELVGKDETVEKSQVEGIVRVRARAVPDAGHLLAQTEALEIAALKEDDQAVIELLQKIVPTYQRTA